MSSLAIDTLSTFGVSILCITLGIMALTLFFKALAWLGARGAKPEPLAVRGVLKHDTWAKVHLAGAETFERVRVIGYMEAGSPKQHLPYELSGMVILEDPEGRRFLVRGKAIKMIVIAPEPQLDPMKHP